MKYNIALIVGRFQPFHKGHLFLIKKALEKAEKVIIGIGSANITDVNNPIDFSTRKKIIKAVFYKEKIEDRLIKIVPLDDFFNDQKWLINLKNQVGDFDLALGNNDWTNNIFKKEGIKIIKVDYCKRGIYEGWRIRNLIKEGKKWQDRVPNYLINFISNLKPTFYNHVVIGGTFDNFHKGHEALINKAFEVGKKITIGIATEELYKKKFLSEKIESFESRKKSVKKYLGDDRIIDIVSFSDIYGPTLIEKNIDAIVVSRETFKNSLHINEERKKINFQPLQIIIIDDILAKDGKLISSERIRKEEIDRDGRLELLMPESLRPVLQKPLGEVFKTLERFNVKTLERHTMIIAVGDIIVDSLLKSGIDPDVKVIDFRSRRREIKKDALIKDSLHEDCLYLNKAGTINLKTASALRSVLNEDGPHNSWFVIDGEEDLLTLPAILFAPINSLVLYGHWQYGIIAVTVDEKIKDKVRKIIKKFN